MTAVLPYVTAEIFVPYVEPDPDPDPDPDPPGDAFELGVSQLGSGVLGGGGEPDPPGDAFELGVAQLGSGILGGGEPDPLWVTLSSGDAFTLGEAKLGEGILGGGSTPPDPDPDPTEGEWVEYLCDANALEIVRGAPRDKLAPAVDVGTLTTTLVNAGDPTDDENVRPNRMIRVRVKDNPDGVIFTGVIQDAFMREDRKGNNFVDIVATDGVQSIANTDRYGAVVEDEGLYETWGERIARLAGSALTPVELPPVGAPTTIYDSVDGPGWTPISSIRTTDVEYLPPARMQKVAIRSRFWRYSPGDPSAYLEPYPWHHGAIQTKRVSVTPGRTYTVSASIAMNGQAYNYSIDRYALYWVQYGEHPDNRTYGEPGEHAGYLQDLELTFQATGPEVTIGIVRAVGGYVEAWPSEVMIEDTVVNEFKVVEHPFEDSVPLQDVNYESSLLNHFNVACASVGARWYVDRNNVAQFRPSLDATPVAINFSDEHPEEFDPDDRHVCYSDISRSYDTRSVVNELTLTNLGRAWDDEANDWRSDDVDYRARNTDSVAEYGPRSEHITTSLYDKGFFAGSVDSLMQQMLARHAEPFMQVTALRFSGTAARHLLPELDIYSQVTVTRRGVSDIYRVCSIKHDLRPGKWMVDIELMKG